MPLAAPRHLPAMHMAIRTVTREHDDPPQLDLGFLRQALPWMLGAWAVVGLVAWVIVVW